MSSPPFRPINAYAWRHVKRLAIFLLIAGSVLEFWRPSAANADANVVVSIKPIHSLVAALMHGAGTPHLIVGGNGSPHVTAMKPSDARALEKADLVFWVGPGMETFLKEPLRNIANRAVIIALAETAGLERLAYRKGGPWESLDKQPVLDRHGFDLHLWLDPTNAQLMAGEIVNALAGRDPARRALYEANGRALRSKLAELTTELNAELAAVKHRPFIVFHDAYQYFERRFGLTAAGSMTVSPERQPGARRLARIRDKIRSLGATCVFAEPQFPPRLLQAAVAGTIANVGTLDPLGADLEAGPELYFTLMRRNAGALRDCLSKGS